MSEYDKMKIAELEKELKELKSKPEPVKKKSLGKYIKTDLFALTRNEQIEIIRGLGHIGIPKREADRVKLILKLTS